LDATWSFTTRFAEPVVRALGADGEEGTIRIVVDGSYAWISARWISAPGGKEIAQDAIVPLPEARGSLNGAIRTIVTHVSTGGEQSVSIGDRLSMSQSPVDLPILLQWDHHLSGLVLRSLSRSIGAMAPEALRIRQDGLVAAAVISLGAADAIFEPFVLLDRTAPIAIAGDSTRAHRALPPEDATDQATEVANGNEALVTDWVTVDDRRLPRRLERSYFTWFPGRDAPDAHVVTYQLVSLRRNSERVESLVDVRRWLPEGTAVSDDRDGALTSIGATTVTIGKSRHRARHPVTVEDVLRGAALSSLCEAELIQSTSAPLIDASDAAASPPTVAVSDDLAEKLGSSSLGPSYPSWTTLRWIGNAALALGVVAGIGGILLRCRVRRCTASDVSVRVGEHGSPPGGRSQWATRVGLIAFGLLLSGSACLLADSVGSARGTRTFDLGSVLVGDGTTYAEGAVLFGTTAELSKTVETLSASCGCLSARLGEHRTIDVGSPLVVPVRVALTLPGQKSIALTAIFSDGTTERVFVQATGLVDPRFRSAARFSTGTLEIGESGRDELTTLVCGTRGATPRVDWRLPPGTTVAGQTVQYLDPISVDSPGQYLITTGFRVTPDPSPGTSSRAFLGAATLLLDGAQAGSVILTTATRPESVEALPPAAATP